MSSLDRSLPADSQDLPIQQVPEGTASAVVEQHLGPPGSNTPLPLQEVALHRSGGIRSVQPPRVLAAVDVAVLNLVAAILVAAAVVVAASFCVASLRAFCNAVVVAPAVAGACIARAYM